MMSSNILSRFLPPTGSPSVYETIRQHDAVSESSDVEERAGLVLEDPQEQFSDRELEDALADAQDSEIVSPSTALLEARSGKAPEERASPSGTRRRKASRPRWATQDSLGYELDDNDEDVPQSLLVEGHHEDLTSRLPPPPRPHGRLDHQRPPSPDPPSQPTRPSWNERPRHIPRNDSGHPSSRWFAGQHPGLANTDPEKKAMWRWANVEDLDNFLKDVYVYFLGNGIWSILLTRVLNLL
jgi:autophagy-related protein 9